MRLAFSTFEFMRRIRLQYDRYVNRWADTRPHPLNVSARQIGKQVTKHARPLGLIAKHCPYFVSLHFNLERRLVETSKKTMSLFEPLVFALKELSQSFLHLETIGYAVPTLLEQSFMMHVRRGSSGFDEKVYVDLADIPMYLRDETVETWCCTELYDVVDKDFITRSPCEEPNCALRGC